MSDVVKNLSEILKLIGKVEGCKEDKVIAGLEGVDTRKTFFEKLANSLRVYYLGIDIIFIVEKVLKNVNFSSFDLSSDEKKNVENAGWILDEKYLAEYESILKMNLINDCWVCFESTLRDIFYVKKFENYKSSIYSIYTDKIFCRNGRKNNDNEEFLKFFGACRNAMHNNSIYAPTYSTKELCEYKFNGHSKPLTLEENKKIDFIYNDTILEMIDKLSDVALNMLGNIDYPGLIGDRYNSILKN